MKLHVPGCATCDAAAGCGDAEESENEDVVQWMEEAEWRRMMMNALTESM